MMFVDSLIKTADIKSKNLKNHAIVSFVNNKKNIAIGN